MRYQLDLTLRRVEGALARVISTAEHRGFTAVNVVGEAQIDGDRWYLRLAVDSERPAALLQAQLEKLDDCLAVEVTCAHPSQEPEQPRADFHGVAASSRNPARPATSDAAHTWRKQTTSFPGGTPMPTTVEDFVEIYLVTRGYPQTDTNRERVRRILAQQPEPNPDFVGWSSLDHLTVLDCKMHDCSW